MFPSMQFPPVGPTPSPGNLAFPLKVAGAGGTPSISPLPVGPAPFTGPPVFPFEGSPGPGEVPHPPTCLPSSRPADCLALQSRLVKREKLTETLSTGLSDKSNRKHGKEQAKAQQLPQGTQAAKLGRRAAREKSLFQSGAEGPRRLGGPLSPSTFTW